MNTTMTDLVLKWSLPNFLLSLGWPQAVIFLSLPPKYLNTEYATTCSCILDINHLSNEDLEKYSPII
jgi:hypothetical protein